MKTTPLSRPLKLWGPRARDSASVYWPKTQYLLKIKSKNNKTNFFYSKKQLSLTITKFYSNRSALLWNTQTFCLNPVLCVSPLKAGRPRPTVKWITHLGDARPPLAASYLWWYIKFWISGIFQNTLVCLSPVKTSPVINFYWIFTLGENNLWKH